ncbi:TIGR02281 family clan AA aspartic protease [Phenylobacterium sp.]|uniref:retropepsin-like aspartic protease family protein n=1 Tax=Phenylobacterium sp. TaxID=1871053 RepID=UPI0027210002|nr:TIGR02281 family clan AA aspartic protease [Phenylobacterium sp.]MDO8381088.1 TIGR02281 family clan AA aspartic protease [Phenylobacterium sp.]
MIKLAAMALIGAVSAVGAAQAVVSLDPTTRSDGLRAAVASLNPQPQPAPAVGGAASIAKASDGHYWAQGTVNGASVRFLVDTGASAVALTAADAQRLGFDPDKLNYAYKVMTANGEARAAAVKLASVSVAGAKLADVDALVLDKGLDASLLGMTYLGRLSSFQATRTALILQP